MKLLLASVEFPPQLGGVATMAHHFAAELAKAGADVHVLALPGAQSPATEPNTYQLYIEDTPGITTLSGPSWIEVALPQAFERHRTLIKSLDPDRLIALHPHYFGQTFVRLSNELGIPVSILAHGFEVNEHLGKTSWRSSIQQILSPAKPTLKDELSFSFSNANEVITNSTFTASLVQQLSSSASTRVIGCGLSPESETGFNFSPANTLQSEARTKLGLALDAKVVGTVCRLVESKGVDTLLRAVAEIPDVQCLIAGDGPERRALENLAQSLGIASRVRFFGATDNQTKTTVLRAMDAFLLLSKPCTRRGVEGFGIVILEAFAEGTPVIASNYGGIPDVIEHEETGLLVAPDSPSHAAQAILRIFSAPELAASTVENGRTAIKQRFRWDKIAQSSLQYWRPN